MDAKSFAHVAAMGCSSSTKQLAWTRAFSPADVQEFVYCIASGRGKIRSASVARNSLLANVTWRVFALLTSEHQFETKRLKRGAALRLAQIPVFDANSAASSTARGYKAALAWREQSSWQTRSATASA